MHTPQLFGTQRLIQSALIGLVVAMATTVRAQSPPVISAVTPASGAVGSTVTLTGSKFSAAPANNVVYFGGVTATVTAATPLPAVPLAQSTLREQKLSIMGTEDPFSFFDLEILEAFHEPEGRARRSARAARLLHPNRRARSDAPYPVRGPNARPLGKEAFHEPQRRAGVSPAFSRAFHNETGGRRDACPTRFMVPMHDFEIFGAFHDPPEVPPGFGVRRRSLRSRRFGS